MSNFRPELHVAQRSRRDKLRNIHEQEGYNNLDQFPAAHDQAASLNSRPLGNISYDPSHIYSEVTNFQDSETPDKRSLEVLIGNLLRTNVNPSASSNIDHPHCFVSSWKSVNGSQSGYDNSWRANDQGPVFIGESPSKSFVNKPYVRYDELQTPAFNNNPSSDQNSSLYYQELVSSSNLRTFGGQDSGSFRRKSNGESSHGPWGVVGGSEGEPLLLPAYADQLKCVSDHQWYNGLEISAINNNRELRIPANDHSNTQALSLSLSSVPPPKVHSTQIADRDTSGEFRLRNVYCNTNVQDNHNNLSSNSNSMIVSKVMGNARQGFVQRHVGPLGPFTGYATILKSSKFLRPTQQLLDEYCSVTRPKNIEMFEDGRVSGDLNASLFLYDGPNDSVPEPGGTSSSMGSYQPSNLQYKTKLLYMQDEVGKRYKQYHRQMQMVVSSFESVAGLSAATPYVSLAIKKVSNNFRCLTYAIMDQLRSLRKSLGEDLSSPTAGTSKDDAGVSMIKFFDQSFQKQKAGPSNAGVLDGQHNWRPHRGLPERAVSILRAWLFDHFLHPYPTDVDKHMLAVQTGLTRNQVSNWFINARVRVWKPMVEEIHTLENKGANDQTELDVGKATVDDFNDHIKSSNSPSNKHVEISQSEKRSRTEYQIPTGVEGSLVGFVPSHHRQGIEIGGVGAVSLTLGLRQSAETAAQRTPLQRFGGQIIRDLVG